MSALAILGGKPLRETPIRWDDDWPPVNETTAKKMQALYLSGEWSFHSPAEQAFTQAFAKAHGTQYGIFTINGTVTLQCALGACGVGKGDEVIMPAFTWYADGMAAYYIGATPVFVDVDNENFCIDPDKIEAAITEKTKAIIVVHLLGSMADMDRIMAIAKKHNLRVVEDCAQMHGGSWDNKPVGSIGDVGSFSFQQSKIMTCGEGGICITNDDRLAERLFRMKHIGYPPGIERSTLEKDSGPEKGLICYPFRATAFQALILNEQLRELNDYVSRSQSSVNYLQERLKNTSIRFQKPGRKASNQAYYGLAMVFDDPGYVDIPLDTLQKAICQEGLVMEKTWGPVHEFVLFNLEKNAYRIDDSGYPVTRHLTARTLYITHPLLGLDKNNIELIGDIVQKVVNNIDELRRYSETG